MKFLHHLPGLEETETLQLVTRLGSWDKPRKPLLFFEVLDVVVTQAIVLSR